MVNYVVHAYTNGHVDACSVVNSSIIKQMARVHILGVTMERFTRVASRRMASFVHSNRVQNAGLLKVSIRMANVAEYTKLERFTRMTPRIIAKEVSWQMFNRRAKRQQC